MSATRNPEGVEEEFPESQVVNQWEIAIEEDDYSDIFEEFTETSYQRQDKPRPNKGRSLWENNGFVAEVEKNGGPSIRAGIKQDAETTHEEARETVDEFVEQVAKASNAITKGAHDPETGVPTAVWQDQNYKENIRKGMIQAYRETMDFDYDCQPGAAVVADGEFEEFVKDTAEDYNVEITEGEEVYHVSGADYEEFMQKFQENSQKKVMADGGIPVGGMNSPSRDGEESGSDTYMGDMPA